MLVIDKRHVALLGGLLQRGGFQSRDAYALRIHQCRGLSNRDGAFTFMSPFAYGGQPDHIGSDTGTGIRVDAIAPSLAWGSVAEVPDDVGGIEAFVITLYCEWRSSLVALT
jgi:hypothetical protein